MKKLKLDTYEVDSDTRDNFEEIERELIEETFRKGEWVFAQVTIDKAYAATDVDDSADTFFFRHTSKFAPKDILITSIRTVEGETLGVPTFLYDNFTNDFIKIRTTNPCIIRFFYGNFNEKGV